MLSNAIKIVIEQNYISRRALLREMSERMGDFEGRSLWADIEKMCQSSDAEIGIIRGTKDCPPWLSDGVLYCKQWVEENKSATVTDAAEILGLDLYRKIMYGKWFWKDNPRNLDYAKLQNNLKDGIIYTEWLGNTPNTLWGPFSRYYKELDSREDQCNNDSAAKVKTRTDENPDGDGTKEYEEGIRLLDRYFITFDKRLIDRAYEMLNKSSELGNPLAKFQIGKAWSRKKRDDLAKKFYDEAIPGLKELAETGCDEAVKYLRDLGIEVPVDSDATLLNEAKEKILVAGDMTPSNVVYNEVMLEAVQILDRLIKRGNKEAQQIKDELKERLMR